MAPGLQSIALFSQIVVDRAQGCTITDVDGNEYLDFIAGIAVGSLGHAIRTWSPGSRSRSSASPSAASPPKRAQSSLSASPRRCRRASPISSFSRAAPKRSRRRSALRSRPRRSSSSSASGAASTARSQGVIGLLGGGYRNHQGPFPPGMHHSPYANCYRCPWNLEHPSCGMACAELLRNVIKRETQGDVAAIIIEPMQGTAGNVIPRRTSFTPCAKSRRGRRDLDRRRDDGRFRPHRQNVGLGACRPDSRPHDDRQGDRRRLPR